MSIVLLVGAGLFVQTSVELEARRPRFRSVESVAVSRGPGAQSLRAAAARRPMLEQIVERLGQVEGLRAVTIAATRARRAGGNFGSRGQSNMPAASRAVFVGISSTPWECRSCAGRSFTPQDGAQSPKVGVVNEAFVRRYFPTATLGKRVWDLEVVGVVEDTKIRALRGEIRRQCSRRTRRNRPGLMMFKRASTATTRALIPAIREIVRQVEPDLAVYDFTTQTRALDRTQLNQERLFANFASALGTVALFLVCVGLYGSCRTPSRAERTRSASAWPSAHAAATYAAMVLRETAWVLARGPRASACSGRRSPHWPAICRRGGRRTSIRWLRCVDE